jgi:hypothetical protein
MINDVTGRMLNHYEKVVVCCRIKNRIAYVRETIDGNRPAHGQSKKNLALEKQA